MKKNIISIVLTLVLVTFPELLPARTTKLLVGGSGWRKIAIIDKQTKQVEWEYPIEQGWECNSVAMTKEGHILFSYKKGARLVNRNKETLWDIKAPEGCEMQSANIIDKHRILLAWTGAPATVLEVDMQGNILSKTSYDLGDIHPHGQFRHVIKRKNGNYLIPVVNKSKVVEITPAGELVRESKVEGRPFAVTPVKGGKYLVAGGDSHCIEEFDADKGEVLRSVRQEIDGIKLFYVAGISVAKNGNLFICNWLGHDRKADVKKDPSIIEINHKGKVVWELSGFDEYRLISDVVPIN